MRCLVTVSLAAAGCVLLLADSVSAQQIRRSEPLRGGAENPPVVSDASGNFRARLFPDRIEFRLRYGLDPADVTQAHLHIANPSINGAIVAFLCANPPLEAPDPATADECPESGVIEGVIDPDDVLAVDDSLEAGDLEGLETLIRQGAVYVNVHTADHPSGEVRGQMSPRLR